MAKPRVLVLNHFAAPRGQAGGTRHVELFSRLDGYEYAIFAGARNHLTGERQPAEPGFVPVPVTPYRSNGLLRIINWISFAVSSVLRSFTVGRISVVYASSPHLLSGLAGWVIAVLRRAPFVLEVRDLWPRVLIDMGQLRESSKAYRVLCMLERFLYARATRIVVMAHGVLEELTARGVPGSKLVYIPNGADPADFTPRGSRDQLRKRYSFTKFTAVYAGAHGPANGLHLVLDAADSLRDRDLDIVLVGGGVTKNELIRDAGRRELSNVRFMDPVSKDEIADVLHAADVGLHVLADVELFRTGVSPNKVFDYMAAGRPVLTNSPGVVGEVVDGAECGVVVEPTALAAGVRKLADLDEGELECLGIAGRRWIAAYQSRSAMVERLADMLGTVIRASRRMEIV